MIPVISTGVICLLGTHFFLRQSLTAWIARESPAHPEYLGGKSPIAALWVLYVMLLAAFLWDGSTTRIEPRHILGYAMLLGGTAIRIGGLLSLRGYYYSTVCVHLSHRVVRRGAYRYLRHPLYLGLAFEMGGLLVGSGKPWLLVVFAIGLLELQVMIRCEQELLRDRLGQPYHDFVSSTWDPSDLGPVIFIATKWEGVRSNLLAWSTKPGKYLPLLSRQAGILGVHRLGRGSTEG